MQLNVTFRHLDSSEALRSHAENKLGKFEKFLHEPIEIHVVLEVQKLRQLAEVTIKAKNFHFHGVEESPNLYASIDLLEDKIQRQLKKHKEKVKGHKSVSPTRDAAVILGES